MPTLRIVVVSALLVATTIASGKSYKSAHQPKSLNSCGQLNDTWSGAGTFTSWITGVCIYEGVWTSETLHHQHGFLLRVNVTKKSGGIFCPRRGKTKFPGQCEHGNIVIHTGRGDLKGFLKKSGGLAQGRVMILPGVNGILQVAFSRMSQ